MRSTDDIAEVTILVANLLLVVSKMAELDEVPSLHCLGHSRKLAEC